MLGVMGATHGFHVSFEVRGDRDTDHLHPQVIGGLHVGGVDGHRSNQLRSIDPLDGTTPLTINEHGIVNALRTPRGNGPGFLVGRIDPGHLFPMEHFAHHGKHLGFELGAARAEVALEQVDIRVQAEDFIQEGIMLHAAVVHGAGALPILPFFVLFLRHVGDLVQHLLFVHPFLGQAREDVEEILVGMQFTKYIQRSLFVRHISPFRGGTPPI